MRITTVPGTTTGSMGTMTEEMGRTDATGLMAELPRDVPASSCKETASMHAGGTKTVDCNFTDKVDGPISLHVDQFKTRKDLLAVYSANGVKGVTAAGGHPDPKLAHDTGNCSGSFYRNAGEGAMLCQAARHA